MGQEIMHIAFCTNANYGPYTGVAMNSMILNNIGEKMVFHILHSGLREDDLARFKATEKLYRDVTVKFYHVTGDDKMASYRTTYHFTKEMFYRWLIPHVVDKDIQNVFYSDGDVICVGSLRELFNLKFAEDTPHAIASPGQIVDC